jgi:hypothetical protein
MNLTSHVEKLREALAVAAEAGGDDARALAERLSAPLDSATRLMLLDALSEAADEITREIAPGSVEVRLRSGEPEFAVSAERPETPEPPVVPTDVEDGATARINLRLPEQLKADVERAAAKQRLSVNAWLVRAVATMVANEERRPRAGGHPGQSLKGWAR